MISEGDPLLPPKNRGVPEWALHPISLSEARERIAQGGFPAAADRIDRWRSAGLLGPTISSGQGNTRLLASIDATRLYRIALLHRDFNVEKIPNDEVAFWLTALGETGMPSGLITEAIVRCTRRYMNTLLRALGRRVGSRWLLLETPARETIESVSHSLTGTLKRALRAGVEIAAVEAVNAGVHAILAQVFRPTSQAGAAKMITVVLRRLGADDAQIAAWMPHVWEGLREVATFFREGDENAFVVAARASSDMATDEAARLVRHAVLMCDLVEAAFPPLKDITLRRMMAPMVAGMLLHLRENVYTQAFRNRIDKDGGDAVRADIAQIAVVVREISVRLIGFDPFDVAASATGTRRRL